MATSLEKVKELEKKKKAEAELKAETIAIQKLYKNKAPVDNSKNKTTNK